MIFSVKYNYSISCSVCKAIYIFLLSLVASCDLGDNKEEEINAQNNPLERKARLKPREAISSIPPTQARISKQVTAKGSLVELISEKVTLKIPSNALKSEKNIEIVKLKKEEIPPLNPGMINVTSEQSGYQLLPAGSVFDKDLELTIPLSNDPYFESLWKSLGAKTYYWHEVEKRWVELQTKSIDKIERKIVSKTNHFTKVISAVLKSPDTTEPSNFNENSIKDIGLANPLSNVDLIEPPKPNSKGDAQVSLPIRIPAGRGDYTPSLNLSYSSSAQNGPLGIGWNLSIPIISVDTRWGVPLYSGIEKYTVGGQALVPIDLANLQSIGIQPECKFGDFIQAYSPRKQDFSKIIKCTSDSDNKLKTHWEVTQANGLLFIYGLSDLAKLYDEESLNIAIWYLEKVIDRNANVTTYEYFPDGGQENIQGHNEPFTQRYLDAIKYTSFDPDFSHKDTLFNPVKKLRESYQIDLNWDCENENFEQRKDVQVSAITGFKVVTRCLLHEIDVSYTPAENEFQLIRKYTLNYQQGHYFKTLLADVKVSSENDDFYTHTFDYSAPEFFDESFEGDQFQVFSEPEIWSIDNTHVGNLKKSDRKLNHSREEGHQGGGGIGVAVEFGAGSSTIGCSVGYNGGYSENNSAPTMHMMDVNGDRIPDKIWTLETLFNSPIIYVALGKLEKERAGCFGDGEDCIDEEVPNNTMAIQSVGKTKNKSGSVGAQASCSFGASVSISGGFSITESLTESMLSDADGDGITDFILGPGVYYRGLPHVCRDGSRPTNGNQCLEDGLLVCDNPNALCFVGDDLRDHTPKFTYTTSANLNGSSKKTRDNMDFSLGLISSAYAQDQDQNQSETIRLNDIVVELVDNEKDILNSPELQSDAIREKHLSRIGYKKSRRSPVIRWMAPYDGEVQANLIVKNLAMGKQDSIEVKLLKVSDYISNHGTSELASKFFKKRDGKKQFFKNLRIPVKSGESLLFTLSSKANRQFTLPSKVNSPLKWEGYSLNKIATLVDITYKKVCRPPENNCYAIDNSRVNKIGPTNQLDYRYSFSSQHSTAELPHQRYWQLLPPLGTKPFSKRQSRLTSESEFISASDLNLGSNFESLRLPIEAAINSDISSINSTLHDKKKLQEAIKKWNVIRQNHAIGTVEKHQQTETAVYARIRCESIAISNSTSKKLWELVCPPGDILAEVKFEANEIGKKEIYTRLPNTFIDYTRFYSEIALELELNISLEPSFPKAGEIYKTIYTVKNISETSVAPASKIQIENALNFNEIVNVPVLKHGESYAYEIETQSPPSSLTLIEDEATLYFGDKLYSDSIEYSISPNENISNETLPELSASIKVTDSGSYSGNFLYAGGEKEVHVRIKNLGTDRAQPVSVKVTYGKNKVTHAFKTKWLMGFADYPNNFDDFRIKIPFVNSGELDVKVEIDPENEQEELNEENVFSRKFLFVDQIAYKKPQMYDPIRVMFEIDGENGYEVSPEAVSWEPKIHIKAVETLKPVLNANLTNTMALGDKKVILEDDREIVFSPPVLYRVHPKRNLDVFTFKNRNLFGNTYGDLYEDYLGENKVKIKATAVYSENRKVPRNPLVVSLTNVDTGENQQLFNVDGTGIPTWRRANTKEQILDLEEGSKYLVRGYTEANYDTNTSFNLLAEQFEISPYLAVFRDHDGYEELKITDYKDIGPDHRIVVYEESEEERIARSSFPESQIISIRLGDDAEFISNEVFEIKLLSFEENNEIKLGVTFFSQPESQISEQYQEFVVNREFIPVLFLISGKADIALIKERLPWFIASKAIQDLGYEGIFNNLESLGLSEAASKFFDFVVKLVAHGSLSDKDFEPHKINLCCKHPQLAGQAENPIQEALEYYPIGFINRLPVNLLRANFGYDYAGAKRDENILKMNNLIGEVAHSFDPWGGGYRNFFIGEYDLSQGLDCIGPLPCYKAENSKFPSVLPHRSLSQRKNNSGHLFTARSSNLSTLLNSQIQQSLDLEVLACTGSNNSNSCKANCMDVFGEHELFSDNTCRNSFCQQVCDCKKGIKFEELACDFEGDGIVRESLSCMSLPEDFNSVQDSDGCPDSGYTNIDGDTDPDVNDDAVLTPETPAPPSAVCNHEDPRDKKECIEKLADRFYAPPLKKPTEPFNIEQSFSFGTNFSAGVNVSLMGYIGAGINTNLGFANTYTGKSTTDWNGDGLLDYMFPENIILGGYDKSLSLPHTCLLKDQGKCWASPAVREQLNTTFSASASANARLADMLMKALNIKPTGLLLAAGASSQSIGVSVNTSHNNTFNDRFDINGDGLPDFVTSMQASNEGYEGHQRKIRIKLNKGYGLGVSESLGIVPQFNPADGSFADSLNDVNQWFRNELMDAVGKGSIREADTITVGNNIGVSGGVSVGIFGGSGSASVNKSVSTAQTSRMLIDINSDGLVDVVEKSPGSNEIKIYLNLGWISDNESVLFKDLSDSFTELQDANLSGDKSLATQTWNSPPEPISLQSPVDNIVSRWAFKTLGWTPPEIIGETQVPVDRDIIGPIDALTETRTNSETISGSISATIFFVQISANYSHTNSSTSNQITLSDMDGDGFPDWVLRSGKEQNAGVQVQRNLMGGANLLKAIRRPAGGKIELEYGLELPSYNDPNSRRILKTVTVSNDFESTDTNFSENETLQSEMVTSFEYHNPYYDRFEKEFYGYEYISITRGKYDENKQLVEDSGDGQYTLQTFHNRDYWLQGSIKKNQIYPSKEDADAALADTDESNTHNLLLQNTYTYEHETWNSLDIKNSVRDQCLDQLILPTRRLNTDILNQQGKTPCDVRFVKLVADTTEYYEGQDTPVVLENTYDQYDEFGNITVVRQNTRAAADKVLYASIDYAKGDLLDRHILSKESVIEVRAGDKNGELLRKRAAEYDQAGNLELHSSWLNVDPTDSANDKKTVINLSYDDYGFLTTVKDSSGYFVEYKADPILHQLVVRVDDYFGLTSSTEYEYHFQQEISATDPNGNRIDRDYDEFGRLDKLWGPYEPSGGTPSVSVTYTDLHQTFPVYAITHNAANNRDEINPEILTIHTAQFIDGLGRKIQTQVQGEVADNPDDTPQLGRIISGKILFDPSGRVEKVGEPEFIAKLDQSEPIENSDFVFENLSWVDVRSTLSIYDKLDRPITQIRPGNRAIDFNYGIEAHPDNAAMLTRVTKTYDPECKVRADYKDAIDQVVAITQWIDYLPPSEESSQLVSRCDFDDEHNPEPTQLVTRFNYSPVGDLTELIDANDNNRLYRYDLSSNKLSIQTQDTGRIEYEYDAMGNLLAWADSELCSGLQIGSTNTISSCAENEKIQQTFDRGRLTSIDYPSPEMADIEFIYGDQDDTQQCSYAGEVLSNTRGRICKINQGAIENDIGEGELRGYGPLGELTASVRRIKAGSFSDEVLEYVTRETYDSFGRLQKLAYQDGEALTYRYNQGGQLKSLGRYTQNQDNKLVAEYEYLKHISYDRYGKPIKTHYGNDIIAFNNFDSVNQRLASQTICNALASGCNANTDNPIKRVTFTYDDADNIEAIDESRSWNNSLLSNITRSYSYDDLHRLSSSNANYAVNIAQHNIPDNITSAYLYDDVGNMLQQQVTLNRSINNVSTVIDQYPTKNWTYSYSYTDQRTGQTRPNLPSRIGPYTFEYDQRGAMIRVALDDGARSDLPPGANYTWNNNGRLSSSQRQGSTDTTHYYYGLDGNRTRKETIDNNAIPTTSQVYGSEYYSESFTWAEQSNCQNGENSCYGYSSIISKGVRVNGQQIALTQMPSEALENTSIHYFHADQVRSTTLVTSGNGEPLYNYEYLPYGEVVQQLSSDLNEVVNFAAFNGKEFDGETGLSYFGARYYDGRLSKWASTDMLYLQFPSRCISKSNQCALNNFGSLNPIKYFDINGNDALDDQLNSIDWEKSWDLNYQDENSNVHQKIEFHDSQVPIIHGAKEANPKLGQFSGRLACDICKVDYIQPVDIFPNQSPSDSHSPGDWLNPSGQFTPSPAPSIVENLRNSKLKKLPLSSVLFNKLDELGEIPQPPTLPQPNFHEPKWHPSFDPPSVKSFHPPLDTFPIPF